jgi:hypothetical protein
VPIFNVPLFCNDIVMVSVNTKTKWYKQLVMQQKHEICLDGRKEL